MPAHLNPSSLFSLSSQAVANTLLTGCRALDGKLQQPKLHDRQISPKKGQIRSPYKSPCMEEVSLHLSPEHRSVLDWLSNLPGRVIEDVIRIFVTKLETHLLDDMDNKLILTMINIENMKMNDFFFGVHSLLCVVQGFQLESLHFTKCLWYCLWQYGEITTPKHLSDTLCSSLPGLSHLTSLTIPHVADDRIVCTVTRYLINLINLDMSNSRVSDRGLKFFSTNDTSTFMRPRYPTRSVIRKLEYMLDEDDDEHTSQRLQNLMEHKWRAGCHKLEHLNIESCDNVTEMGVICIIENLVHLKNLEYHQKSSVLEILIKWNSSFTDDERSQKALRLKEVEHSFPNGLPLLSDHMSDLSMLLPCLTTITLVTTDSSVSLLAMFPCLTKITVELEDCLGEGFIEMLSMLGDQLEELCMSCTSDPGAPHSLDQVEGPAAQQGQLFNLAILCVGLLAKRVSKLFVSGCGLVSSDAVNTMGLQEKMDNSSWLENQSGKWFSSLTSLIILAYDDSLPTMNVHSGLMKSVLTSAKELKVLNLEGNFVSFFTDNYFNSILSSNPMLSLNFLDIFVSKEGSYPGRIPLSCQTVWLILSTCKSIKELRISDWSVASPCYGKFQELVKENNWDLMICRKIKDPEES